MKNENWKMKNRCWQNGSRKCSPQNRSNSPFRANHYRGHSFPCVQPRVVAGIPNQPAAGPLTYGIWKVYEKWKMKNETWKMKNVNQGSGGWTTQKLIIFRQTKTNPNNE